VRKENAFCGDVIVVDLRDDVETPQRLTCKVFMLITKSLRGTSQNLNRLINLDQFHSAESMSRNNPSHGQKVSHPLNPIIPSLSGIHLLRLDEIESQLHKRHRDLFNPILTTTQVTNSNAPEIQFVKSLCSRTLQALSHASLGIFMTLSLRRHSLGKI
jgi:hypothetical protein